MKKIVIGMMMIGMMMATLWQVQAETYATAKIYVLLQDAGYKNEMEVDLINQEDPSKVYTFSVKEEDDWVKKVSVPEGTYKAEARVKFAHKYGPIRATQSDFPKEVKVGSDEDAPIFTVLQGDWEYIEKYQWLCDYSDNTGKKIRGTVKKEDLGKMLTELVEYQDKEYMDGGSMENAEEISGEITEEDLAKAAGEVLDSGYQEEKEEVAVENEPKTEKLQAEKEKEDNENDFMIFSVIVAIMGALAIIIFSKKKNKKK